MLQHPPTPHHAPSQPFTPCKTPSRRNSTNGLQFTPSLSSPLSPRPSRAFNGSCIIDSSFSTVVEHEEQPSVFALSPTANLPSPPRSPQNAPSFMTPRRLFKPNPINRSREDNRTARRDLFLKKVQNGRFDKTMAARGGEDEMMRMIFVAEQKRWEQNLERGAPSVATILEEEEEEEEIEEDGIDDMGLDPGFVPEEYDEEELERMAKLAESEYARVLIQEDEFDEYLDKDGQELEDLLSQMDLDVEMS